MEEPEPEDPSPVYPNACANTSTCQFRTFEKRDWNLIENVSSGLRLVGNMMRKEGMSMLSCKSDVKRQSIDTRLYIELCSSVAMSTCCSINSNTNKLTKKDAMMLKIVQQQKEALCKKITEFSVSASRATMSSLL